MKRREFITLLGSAVGWPFTARAQRQEAAVIGLLNAQSGGGASQFQIAELRRGLEDSGFVEGQNLQIEYRSDAYHIRDLAADLVKRQVAVIICIGDAEGVHAAKESTSTIPIVFAADPHFDFDAYNIIVKSVNWPSANVTGNIWSPSSALANKRFELLSKLVPNAKLVGYLDNLTNSSSRNVYGRDYVTDEGDAITRDLGSHIFATGRSLLVFEEAFTERRIESAFEDMAREGVEMLVVSPDAYLSTYRNRIADLAKRYMIAAITGWRELVPQGGLISYSPVEGFRQAGVYAARILKGAKPGDLPIQHLSKLELFINLKTAKTLGLIVPQEFLAIADGVIE